MPTHRANRFLLHALGAVLTVVMVACGTADEGDTETNAAEQVSGQVSAAPRGGPRDLAALDLCALVPATDVAAALGYPPGSASAEANMGQWSVDCTYTFARGGGLSDYAILGAYPPELWAAHLRDGIEEVPGLGDAAFQSTLGAFDQMNVLLEGDLFLDARANSPEQARDLAELAVERLAD